ncbi:MAG TPA: sigma-70 family RNA polymerase sigma factor [Gemmatimonadales bacterium]|nr:sigma-70 family RNA polymerase sigma factor [Gemmatimonadales bacterium]
MLTSAFEERFVALFEAEFPRLFRYLDRLSGEPDLAADLAQDAFVRLNKRGEMPEKPEAWLITVALNLFRNVKASRSRRRRLLTLARAESILADPAPSPAHLVEAADSGVRVRAAIDRLPEREQKLLLLRAEGYSYRDMASALDLTETSIGTLLARAKRSFREAYEDELDAP